ILSKEISANKDKKVRWVLQVNSIQENFVLLSMPSTSTFNLYLITGNQRYNRALVLAIGQGISKEKATTLNPGDKLTIGATVSDLTLNEGYILTVLKDLQATEARK